MSGASWYYLHTNGDLIHKRFRPEDDSPFVRRVWEIDRNRTTAWRILLEAAALGANVDRLKVLCEIWGVLPDDLEEYVKHTGLAEVNAERRRGMIILAEKVWRVDLDELFVGILTEHADVENT